MKQLKHPTQITYKGNNWVKYTYVDLNITLDEWMELAQEISGDDPKFVGDDKNVRAYVNGEYAGYWFDETGCCVYGYIE